MSWIIWKSDIKINIIDRLWFCLRLRMETVRVWRFLLWRCVCHLCCSPGACCASARLTCVVIVRFGESLRQLSRQIFDAVHSAGSPFQIFLFHPDVSHIPHQPEAQAGEQQQRAGVDEEIPVKHATLLHVAEDAEKQQDQAGDVEHYRHDE